MTPAQQSRREALAKVVYGACWPQETGWPDWCGADQVAQRRAEAVADFIIAEQERREGPLVKAAEVLAKQGANHYGPYHVVVSEDALVALRAALAAYRAIDAPPQRTVEDVLREWNDRAGSLEARAALAVRLLDELAALKRGKE